jgi:fimbrial chaperone protein
MNKANGAVTMCRIGLVACSRAVALFAAALLFTKSDPALGASFSIDPLKVNLTEGRTSTVMRVQNNGTETLTLQLQPRRWEQDGTNDRLVSTRELVATPQIFRIKPGSTQLVRIALMRQPDPDDEIAYRLVFDEIVTPLASDFIGVQVAMRVTIPLFVSPQRPAKPGLQVSVKDSGNGKLAIIVDNRGNAHAHLKKFIVTKQDDKAIAPMEIESPAYLLSGVVREFQVSRPSWLSDPSEKILIKAIGVSGAVEFDGPALP